MTVSFTHTSYQTEVRVFPEQVVGIMYLPSMKSTVLVGPGSTAIPVTCSIEEADEKISAALSAARTTYKLAKEATDGI